MIQFSNEWEKLAWEEGHRRGLPKSMGSQVDNMSPEAERRRNLIVKHLKNVPGRSCTEISAALNLYRNTVANDLGHLITQGRVRAHDRTQARRIFFAVVEE